MSAIKQRVKENVARPEVRRLEKSSDAFRTISEVADEIEVPQHVLRFWETKFPQVKPMKRGGGRRYYRPEDVEILRMIRGLLYDQGYTIKGVQKLLRDGGLRMEAERSSVAVDNVPAPVLEADHALKAELDSLPLFQSSGLSDAQLAELKLITDELLDLQERLGRALAAN